MKSNPEASVKPTQLVEHFFRHETGRLHGALLRMMGAAHLQLAEDVAQEAMLRALRVWSMGGVPPNPSAWITRVAMNLARDAMRHRRMAVSKESAISLHDEQIRATPAVAWEGANEIRDNALRLIFVCCHPVVAPDAQVVLALKVVCGFSVAEIAHAFLSSEAAIGKQLTRTKQRLREAGVPFEIPEGEALAERLEGVLGTLYLLFNEGYKASAGERLIKEEICQESVRLMMSLIGNPVGRTPQSHALLALMLFNSARFPTRLNEEGDLLLLHEQDRSKWDQKQIDSALLFLSAAGSGPELSVYHVEASIAAAHCVAPDYASTDWTRILASYDQLYRMKPSPVVALNRSVAVARIYGPQAGLEVIAAIPDRERLESRSLYHAVIADLYARRGDHSAEVASLRRALALADEVGPERHLLTRRLRKAEGSD